ncbi:MAG: septum formation initiator family protein [Nitrospinota bacterium]|nr:septum formation initiator family protein [Nitrospinota bacterium]MDH5679246.1 septum formation initiator family protein [Nitrospinota bacterium]MDH5757356.1 septum formation initiator family protein [Nitrospinota bacterium]
MRSDRGSAALGLSILFFLVMGLAAYYKDNGLSDVAHLRQEISSISGQRERLTLENNRLQEELDNLSNGQFIVESIAREDLGLVRPDEVVYEFIDSKTLQNPLGHKKQ